MDTGEGDEQEILNTQKHESSRDNSDELQSMYAAINKRPRDFSLRGSSTGIPNISSRVQYTAWNDMSSATHQNTMNTLQQRQLQNYDSSSTRLMNKDKTIQTQSNSDKAAIQKEHDLPLPPLDELPDVTEQYQLDEFSRQYDNQELDNQDLDAIKQDDVFKGELPVTKKKKIKLKHRWWFDIFRTKEPKIHYPKYKPGETNPAITIEDFDDVESQIPDLHRVGTRVPAADGATDATVSGDVRDVDGPTCVTVEKQNVEKMQTRTTRRRSSALSTASGQTSRSSGSRHESTSTRRGSSSTRRESSSTRRGSSATRRSSRAMEQALADLEDDPELAADLNEMMNKRKKSEGRGKKKRLRKQSTHSSASTDAAKSQRDFTQMYTDEFDTTEDQLFENIQIQKEIIAQMRTQTWCMRRKLKMLRIAKAYVSTYEGQLSKGHGYQEIGAKFWKKFTREFDNVVSILIPWEMRIKRTESYFGSVVASYFTFIRWIFWLNIVLLILTICFIVVPEILSGRSMKEYADEILTDVEQKIALNFDSVLDFEGYLEHSIMFYGYYGYENMRGYRLPLAYFLAGMSTYAVSCLMILRKMASNSRQNKISDKDEQYSFSWKLFTQWDYMIGNFETAKNKVAEIVTVFKEAIIEEEEKEKEEKPKLLIFLRVLANFLVLLVLAASTYAIILVVERSRDIELKIERGEDVNWWDQNEISIVMSLITALFPSIFDLIGLMEKFHPRTNLRVSLSRILVLYLLNLYTFMFAMYYKITEMNDKALEVHQIKQNAILCYNTSTSLEGTTALYTVTDDVTDMTSSLEETTTMTSLNCSTITSNSTSESSIICWETMLGQEVVKLTVFDLIVTVATIIVIDFIRGLVVRYFNPCCCWDMERKFPEYGEFKIAENLLHVVNNQAMVWMGLFFSPMLPALNLVKLVVLLYVRNWAVTMCNIPHERVFRASRSNNFYFVMLLLMLFLATLPVIFLTTNLRPSFDCGPLREYEKAYYVLTETMEEEFPSWMNKLTDQIASPTVIMPALVLLLLGIYYLISLTGSLKEALADLRKQLHIERTEEKQKIYEMAQGKPDGDSSQLQSVLNTSQLSRSSTDRRSRLSLTDAATLVMADRRSKNASLQSESTPSGRSSYPHSMSQPREDYSSSRHIKTPVVVTTDGGYVSSSDTAPLLPSQADVTEVRPGVKVMRIPGLTAQQAESMKQKNPAVKLISRKEAEELNLIETAGRNEPQGKPPSSYNSSLLVPTENIGTPVKATPHDSELMTSSLTITPPRERLKSTRAPPSPHAHLPVAVVKGRNITAMTKTTVPGSASPISEDNNPEIPL